MNISLEYLGYAIMMLGTFFMFSAALGLIRMPDVFTRVHPAGVGDAFGAPLVLVGVAVQHGISLYSLKVLVLVLFLMVTSATATHVVVKCAMMAGKKPVSSSKKKRKKDA